MTTNIYILKLQNNKYYVGKTDNIETRKQQHINGTASTWTKKYPPISIEKIIPNASHFDEDKYTLEYMGIYGPDNVRGGQYVSEALDENQRYNIKKSIWAANDCCNQCGRKGHFVKYCKYDKDVNGVNIYKSDESDVWGCEYCDKEFDTETSCEKHEKYCKRKIEESFNCKYCNKEFETQKGATFHENVHCTSKNKNKNINSKKSSVTCYRCGRDGHKSPDCYARTDVDGDYLDSDD